MSGPQDVGIRQRGRGGPAGRSPGPLSPNSEPDDEHAAAYRTREREGFSIEKLLETQKYPSLTYLQNNYTSIQVNGCPILVYGSPDTPRHGSWAFQYSRVQPHQVGTSMVWQDIPDDVDILVTHGPPSFHLDLGGLGCLALLCRLWQVRLRLHVFGHIHASRGIDVMRWTPLQALYEKIMQGDRRFSTIARYIWHAVHTQRVEEPFATTLVNAAVVGGFRDEIINSAVVVCL